MKLSVCVCVSVGLVGCKVPTTNPQTIQDISSRFSLCTTSKYDESLGFVRGWEPAHNMNNANVFVLEAEKFPIPPFLKLCFTYEFP